ncbi:hypothetical protein J1N35_005926 [Gossypium stocksii]|uniref:Transmembrane protein n=1 Tax=Gossypium stocksii TaxID=47602 RepID=A0A9D4AJR3_9ROSI|nr:hypothetical protein J1N35_005926 [Gossypium stocksii]
MIDSSNSKDDGFDYCMGKLMFMIQNKLFLDDVSAPRTDWDSGFWQKEPFLEIPFFVFHLYCAFVFRLMMMIMFTIPI